MQLTRPDNIKRHYDHIYVSPHFDDAAASCGGRIILQAAGGKRVLVVTVFTSGAAAEKPSKNHHARPMLDYPRRRLEDKAAMAALGVDYLWLGYTDMPFRGDLPLFRYWPYYRNTPSNAALCRMIRSDPSITE